MCHSAKGWIVEASRTCAVVSFVVSSNDSVDVADEDNAVGSVTSSGDASSCNALCLM